MASSGDHSRKSVVLLSASASHSAPVRAATNGGFVIKERSAAQARPRPLRHPRRGCLETSLTPSWLLVSAGWLDACGTRVRGHACCRGPNQLHLQDRRRRDPGHLFLEERVVRAAPGWDGKHSLSRGNGTAVEPQGRLGVSVFRGKGVARGAGLGWEAQRVGGALVQIRNEPQGRPGPAREHARPRRRKRAALTTQTEAPVGMRFGRNIDDPARARPSQTASRSISVTPSETPIGLRLRAQYRPAQCRRRYTPTTTPRICVLRQSFLGMRIGAMSLFAGCNRTCSRSG